MWDAVSWKMASCYLTAKPPPVRACPKLLFAIEFISEQGDKKPGLVGQLHTCCIRSQVASPRRISISLSCLHVPGS